MVALHHLLNALADQFEIVGGIKDAVDAEGLDLVEQVLFRLDVHQGDAGHIVEFVARSVQGSAIIEGIDFVAIAENHAVAVKGTAIELIPATGALGGVAGEGFDMAGKQPVVERVGAEDVHVGKFHTALIFFYVKGLN